MWNTIYKIIRLKWLLVLCRRNAALISAIAAVSSFMVSLFMLLLSDEIARAGRIDRTVGLEGRFNSDKLVEVKNRIEAAWFGGSDECFNYHDESFSAGEPIWTMHQ